MMQFMFGGEFESINEQKYDTKYMAKQPSAQVGNLPMFNSIGQPVDSNIPSGMLLFGGDPDILVKVLSGVQAIPLTEEVQ